MFVFLGVPFVGNPSLRFENYTSNLAKWISLSYCSRESDKDATGVYRRILVPYVYPAPKRATYFIGQPR